MRFNGIRAQRGVTLIELLVVMATMGILSATSMSTYKAYREGAYNSVSESAVKSAQIALEAGVINLQDSGTFWSSAWTQVSGPVSSWNGIDIVPGLTNPAHHELFVYYDSSCDVTGVSACIAAYVQARHCKGTKYNVWYRLSNGTSFSYDFSSVGAGSC